MNKFRLLSILTAFICLPLFFSSSVFAQSKIKIKLDFESAKSVADLLGRKKISEAELDKTAKLYGNQQLIRKVKSYDKNSSDELFKKTLPQAIENQKMDSDPYQWQESKLKLKEIKLIINEIERNQTAFLQDITNLILPYSPNDLDAEIRACFLVGGPSLGFAFSREPAFNVALQKLDGDYEGLKYLVAHELYHSIQGIGERKRNEGKNFEDPPTNILNGIIFAANVLTEGTATLVGDSTSVKNPRLFTVKANKDYQKNRERARQNFALLEALLYQSFNDSEADQEEIYNIGFTTAFDETLYHAGYEMAKVIEKYRGKQAIASFIGKNPIAFFRVYLEICEENKDAKIFRFNKTSKSILQKLIEYENKIYRYFPKIKYRVAN